MLSVAFKQNSLYAITAILLLSTTPVNCNAEKIDTNSNSSSIANNNSTQKLTVDVYYETLCPDSIRFIRYQLYEAMIDKHFLNYTDLNFIPYGKVTIWTDPFTNKKYLNCQHGQRECEQNALHACIVENNSIFDQVQMIDCLMGRYTVKECTDILNIDVSAALRCQANRTIEDILKKYGEKTKTIDLWFVPSIGMDGTFEPQLQNRILGNFAKVFCSKYQKKYNVKLNNC